MPVHPRLSIIAKPTRKPQKSAFLQQELPAYRFMATTSASLPILFFIGISFIPIGLILLYLSNKTEEVLVDYTKCKESLVSQNGSLLYTGSTCEDVLQKKDDSSCVCHTYFEVKKNIPSPVFMYYSLENFHQNHRMFVKSRDDQQLLGRLTNVVSSHCKPFIKGENNKTIAPCGAVANALFSDKLEILAPPRGFGGKIENVPLLKTGIAWYTDRTVKFRNPDAPHGLKKAFENYDKPIAWRKHVYELDEENPENNGFVNEDFIVWMRISPMPTFRKLHRRIDHNRDYFKSGVPEGRYILKVTYLYDVSSFKGRKRMILSTTSILGAKNNFFGLAFIIFGCFCIFTGHTMLFIYVKIEKKNAYQYISGERRKENARRVCCR